MQAIKKIRKQKNIKQEYIAQQMGVSVATVSRWETGEFSPRTNKLNKLAEILGCDLTDLLQDAE